MSGTKTTAVILWRCGGFNVTGEGSPDLQGRQVWEEVVSYEETHEDPIVDAALEVKLKWQAGHCQLSGQVLKIVKCHVGFSLGPIYIQNKTGLKKKKNITSIIA